MRNRDQETKERGRGGDREEGWREAARRDRKISQFQSVWAALHTDLEDENPWKALVFLPSSRHTHGLAYRWADRD